MIASLLMALALPLTTAERAVVDYIDGHNDEALALLERVVNINSGTQNHEGIREVGRVFSQELESIGLRTLTIRPSGRSSPPMNAGRMFPRRRASASGMISSR